MTPSFSIPRRHFVRALFLATAYSSFRGAPSLTGFTDAQAADIPYPAGTLRVDLRDFPELLKDNGSIYVSAPEIPDLIVTRLSDNRFFAVTSVCTHEGCTVGTYDPQSGLLECPCHHSRYAPDGQVVDGPAPRPLYIYTTRFDGANLLTIDLVKFAFPISGVVVPVRGRLQISFDSETGHNYEVRFKSGLADSEWEVVPFSERPEGEIDQTLIMGTDGPISLYVEANKGAGFYLIARWKLLGA